MYSSSLEKCPRYYSINAYESDSIVAFVHFIVGSSMKPYKQIYKFILLTIPHIYLGNSSILWIRRSGKCEYMPLVLIYW